MSTGKEAKHKAPPGLIYNIPERGSAQVWFHQFITAVLTKLKWDKGGRWKTWIHVQVANLRWPLPMAVKCLLSGNVVTSNVFAA